MEEKLAPSILVITERYYPERFLVNDLVDEWAKRGCKVTVLTQIPSYPADRLYEGFTNVYSSVVERGVRVIRVPTVLGYKKSVLKKILNYISFMMRATIQVFSACRDADHVFVYHTGPLSLATPVVVAKGVYRRRTTIWTQDVWPDAVFAYGFPNKGTFAVVLKQFVRFIYAFCDEVVVSSPVFIDRLRAYVRKGVTARFIPQWVPTEFLRAEKHDFEFPSKSSRFIFTGNIGSMQNLDIVIEAFSKLDEETATLYILGDGSRREYLENMIETKKIRNVNFLGSVPQEKVLSCIRDCDFSVLSLISSDLIDSTIPAKFQAYLAAGKPMIAIAHGAVAEIVSRKRLGLVAPPDAVDGIVETLRSAITASREQKKEWARNMKALLDSEYDRTRTIDALTGIVCGISP